MTRQVELSLDLPLVLRLHRDKIAETWADMAPRMPGLHPLGPPPPESVAVIKRALDAIAESVSAGSYAALDTYLNDINVIRVATSYDIEVVIESLLLIKSAVLPFIAGPTPASPFPYQAITQLDDCLQYIIRRFGRLYAGMQRRLQEQQRRTALLLRAMQLASSSLELDVVMRRVAEAMAEAVRVAYCGMYLLDAERGVLVTKVATRDSGDFDHPSVHPRRSGLASVPAVLEALEGKRFMVIGAPQLNSLFDQAVIAELGLTLVLVAPIQVGERVLGFAVLGATEVDHTFTSEEIDLATGMSNAVALAIDNIRLYEQTCRRLDESQSLQRVTTALLQKLDLTPILEIVCSAAQRLTGAQGSVVFLLEDDNWLRVAHTMGAPSPLFTRKPVESSFTGRAVRDGKPVMTNNPTEEVWRNGTDTKLTSLMAAPLNVRGLVIGALDAMNKPGGFTEEDAQIISLFADQAAIAIENARLRQQEEQLAVLEERQRLSRELHDSVTQGLYSVTLFADAATRLLATGNSAGAMDHMQQLRRIAQDALGEMRLLIFELRPLDLEKQGLIAALQARLTTVENRAGLSVEFQIEGETRLPVYIEDVLYRVAQEALNNVLKHAQARCVTVRLQLGEARVRLEVADDGIGFDPAVVHDAGGLGLGGMRERVQRIGGTLNVESAPGRGTQVRVEVSLP